MPKRSNIFKSYTSLVIIWAILELWLFFIFYADYADNDTVYDRQPPQMYFSGK